MWVCAPHPSTRTRASGPGPPAPRGPHPPPRAPRRPLLPPAGQASITAPERPPSRLLRAPRLSSLGLPHLHSLGSRLLGKVTSAHSRSQRLPPRRETPPPAARRGRGGPRGRKPGRQGGGPGEQFSGGSWRARERRERPGAEGRRRTPVGFEPQVLCVEGVARGGQHRAREAAPRQPAWNLGSPNPVPSPAPPLERGQPYRAVSQESPVPPRGA